MASRTEKNTAPLNPGDPMMTFPYHVQRLRHETYDTFTVELRQAREFEVTPFEAGQFNMLYVFGLGEVPISISGDPGSQEKLVHTVRAVGDVTKAMRKLRRGNIIGVRGPYGTTWPLAGAKGKDVLIIAGGIGLAPLRPSVYHLLNNRDQYGKLNLLYGTRTPEDILFLRDLEKWRSRLDIEVFITVDRAVGEWHGNVGVVTTLIPKAIFDPHNTIAMIVGPEIMMRFSILELQKRGLENKDIYLSMERSMKCGVGLCGHCQMGGAFVCKDGPVFRYDEIKETFVKREI